MNKKHSLIIDINQDEKNGAHVELHLEGDEHVIAAAVAGLLISDMKFLRIMATASEATARGAVDTFEEKPAK